jgi:hypothetical protein
MPIHFSLMRFPQVDSMAEERYATLTKFRKTVSPAR